METLKKSKHSIYAVVYMGYRVFDANMKRLRYKDCYTWQNDNTVIDVRFDFAKREYYLDFAV